MKTSDPKETSRRAPKHNFKSFFFDSALGYFFYYFLRNDWIWKKLKPEEKEFIKKQNEYWNNHSEGYDSPENYQGQKGKSFLTDGNRLTFWEGLRLHNFLQTKRPKKIIEIGPGSGYYSRLIIDQPFVEEYIAVDVNLKFLEFIKQGIQTHPRAKLMQLGFLHIDTLHENNIEADAIIFMSALHHIPDREDFIRKISTNLSPNGFIFFYEPLHSIRRIFLLFISFFKNRWFSTRAILARNNYMTHHFCTISETRDIAHKLHLSLDWDANAPLLLRPFRRLAALFSSHMIAILGKM